VAELEIPDALREARTEVGFPETLTEIPPDIRDAGPGDLADLGWYPEPGEPGYPCVNGQDCNSGFCIQTPDGMYCTTTCQEECPFGWTCALHIPSRPDEIYICVPSTTDLCRPCMTNSECWANGVDAGQLCADYGPAGNFCGSPCLTDSDCPTGFMCHETDAVDGATAWQCVLKSGECKCNKWYSDEGAKTTCYAENEFGSCEGERACLAQGLSACSAKAPAAETCNGDDDDCDGDVDEGLDGAECLLTNPFGSCPGTTWCINGQVLCQGDEAMQELCDGKDNDCDGATDEGFPDTDDDGVADCLEVDKDGDAIPDVQDNCPSFFNPGQEDFDLDTIGDACDPDDDNDMVADVSDCAPFDADSYPEALETCDGIDNNCNYIVDEGFPDTDFDGWKDCVDDDDDNDDVPDNLDCEPLNPNIYPGADEVCDGLDNDCDETVDEGYGSTTCGLGGCKHTIDNCDNGVMKICNPFEGAAAELCDGKDNDCDGLFDEDLGWLECGIGQCKHNVPVCIGGEPNKCDPKEGASQEVCDGKDNDCDGEADEELGATTCGFGECEHTVDNCSKGVPQICNPFQGAQLETCDGEDNDCDGLADEDLGVATCGLGQCFHSVPKCVDGQPGDCDPLEGAQDEVCDGKDNDCDGKVDQELGLTYCGLGQCGHQVDNCSNGVTQVCDPLEGAGPETCDGVDNDCNGQVDEELGSVTCGLGQCEHTVDICVGGQLQQCNAFEGAQAETCDSLDNDCDGLLDEELGTTTCGQGECEHTIDNCQDGQLVQCDPFEGAVDEICDGKDNDCNGAADPKGSQGCEDYYLDGDSDGYGIGDPKCLCGAEAPYIVTLAGDCDDNNNQAYPAPHAVCGLDADCDGQFADVGEQCDDGNLNSGDGCDATCQLEAGLVLTGTANNGQFGYEGDPPFTIGTIPGKPGMKIVISKVGLCGDADCSAGPKRFVAVGGGLNFSWAAGQNQCDATHWLGCTQPTQGNGRGFVYADVVQTAAVGQSVDVKIDLNKDWDGHYCHDTDTEGNAYDDSGNNVSVRGWVLYHYE